MFFLHNDNFQISSSMWACHFQLVNTRYTCSFSLLFCFGMSSRNIQRDHNTVLRATEAIVGSEMKYCGFNFRTQSEISWPCSQIRREELDKFMYTCHELYTSLLIHTCTLMSSKKLSFFLLPWGSERHQWLCWLKLHCSQFHSMLFAVLLYTRILNVWYWKYQRDHQPACLAGHRMMFLLQFP